jgi:hypothetical protein
LLNKEDAAGGFYLGMGAWVGGIQNDGKKSTINQTEILNNTCQCGKGRIIMIAQVIAH